MTTQVRAAIVISQATVSPPGGYTSGPRDDLIQGQTITLTNLSDTGVIAWQWEISPPLGRTIDDYGVTGLGTSTVTIAPPADPDGAGDIWVRLTTTGQPLPSGLPNEATIAATIGIRLPSAAYAPGIPYPNSLEEEAGRPSAIDPARGSKGRIIEALKGLAASANPARQSHSDAVLWYPMSDASSTQDSRGTTTTALTIAGTSRAAVPGPFGKCMRFANDCGLTGAPAVGQGIGSCTIWAWIIPDIATDSSHIWGRYQTSDGERRFSLDTSSGIPSLTAKADTTETVAGTYPLVGGIPNLLVGVYDSDESTLTLNVNGFSYDPVALTGTVHWSNETPGQVVWGCGTSAHTDSCAGLVLELGLTESVFDQSMIDTILAKGRRW